MIERVDSFRNRLEEAMRLRGKRAIDIVNATGISESAMSQYRKGMIEPKREKLMALAEYLRVDPTWLMGLDVPMETTVHYDYIFDTTPEETNILELYRQADPETQEMIKKFLAYAEKMKEGKDV